MVGQLLLRGMIAGLIAAVLAFGVAYVFGEPEVNYAIGFEERAAIAAGEDPAEFIETKLSVSERKYGALPESWRKGFEPARTVRSGKPKFRLVLNEEVR